MDCHVSCLLQLRGTVHSTTQQSGSQQKNKDHTRGGENGVAQPGENLLTI